MPTFEDSESNTQTTHEADTSQERPANKKNAAHATERLIPAEYISEDAQTATAPLQRRSRWAQPNTKLTQTKAPTNLGEITDLDALKDDLSFESKHASEEVVEHSIEKPSQPSKNISGSFKNKDQRGNSNYNSNNQNQNRSYNSRGNQHFNNRDSRNDRSGRDNSERTPRSNRQTNTTSSSNYRSETHALAVTSVWSQLVGFFKKMFGCGASCPTSSKNHEGKNEDRRNHQGRNFKPRNSNHRSPNKDLVDAASNPKRFNTDKRFHKTPLNKGEIHYTRKNHPHNAQNMGGN